MIKTFSVENILTEPIWREEVKLNPQDFPCISKENLLEAGKPLPRKYLDLQIGNPDLALQPVCQTGLGCEDCWKGHCLYRSRFGSGLVPLGSFGKNQNLANSVKHVTLNKISLPLQGLFFQRESLGVSLLERCTHSKLRMVAECWICRMIIPL